MTSVIQCTGISKAFGHNNAVNSLSMSVSDGEIFVLLGSSGCGKTTTLRLIAGLDNLDNGSIYILFVGVNLLEGVALSPFINL